MEGGVDDGVVVLKVRSGNRFEERVKRFPKVFGFFVSFYLIIRMTKVGDACIAEEIVK